MNRIVEFDISSAAPAASLRLAEDLRALVLTTPGEGALPQLDLIHAQFARTDTLRDIPALQRELAVSRGGLDRTVLFFDLDAMGGIGAAFDTLRGIRTLYPDVVVVMVTRTQTMHAFDASRLPICDVTLGAGFDEGDLDLALLAGDRNNRVWVKRLADLEEIAA